MSAYDRIVLRLEVDREGDPISGTVIQSGQADRPFIGWLALTDAIESIRGGRRAEASRPVLHIEENLPD